MDKSIYNIKENDLTYGRGYVYSLQYHIVWYTKYRKRTLRDVIDEELSRKISTAICRFDMEEGCDMLYDRDIREPLYEFLELQYEKIRIIEEKQMGRSRADIVMVLPEEIIGIEIKSDADTYVRLARQVKDYNRFFDRNYVVVGTSHAMHIEEHVPDWWGIITVEEEKRPMTDCVLIENSQIVDFYILRKAKKNPKMDMKKKISILWRPELAKIQEQNGMHKYERRSKEFVIDQILEKVEPELLNTQISELLFERDYQKMLHEIEEYRIARAAKAGKIRRRGGRRRTAR